MVLYNNASKIRVGRYSDSEMYIFNSIMDNIVNKAAVTAYINNIMQM